MFRRSFQGVCPTSQQRPHLPVRIERGKGKRQEEVKINKKSLRSIGRGFDQRETLRNWTRPEQVRKGFGALLNQPPGNDDCRLLCCSQVACVERNAMNTPGALSRLGLPHVPKDSGNTGDKSPKKKRRIYRCEMPYGKARAVSDGRPQLVDAILAEPAARLYHFAARQSSNVLSDRLVSTP
jgi:hypothetical protein